MNAQSFVPPVLEPLDDDEREFLLLQACGWSIEEIAATKGYASQTIKNRLTIARQKLQARTPSQAVIVALVGGHFCLADWLRMMAQLWGEPDGG